MVDFARSAGACFRILGDPVTVTPGAGGADIVGRGILDLNGGPALGGVVIDDAPVLFYPTSDFPHLSRGDLVALAAGNYRVSEKPTAIGDGLHAVAKLTQL